MAGHWHSSEIATEMSTSIPCLTDNKNIIYDYDSKALERTMLKANESFGHGRGACMGLSLDELAVIEHHLRVTTNALDAYYSQ
jgi:hypothetical protein